ncbi:MAG: hypothetical protein QXY05_04435 [Candidatus Anstonellales archaeon]
MIQKLSSKNGFVLYRVRDRNLPEKTFILSSKYARDVLFKPYLAGKELQGRMDKVGETFVKAMGMAVKGSKLKNACELVLLSGGLFYGINHGFKKVYGEALPQCFIGIKRRKIEGTKGRFVADADYKNFESLPNNATIIIGDTIATAATLEKATSLLFNEMKKAKLKLNRLIITSLACSYSGGKRIRKIEKEMKRSFPDSELFLFVCEEFFHLMPDGTDLRFFGKTALFPEETKKHILKNYGEFLGRKMKCAVFDWGTRCKNPLAHYNEFLHFCNNMLKDKIDQRSRKILLGMKRKAERKKMFFEKLKL